MRYVVVATDYDGTLAHDGRVLDEHLASLQQLMATGRRLVLVTGRQLDDLRDVFPHLSVFERVVVENGAVLFRPDSREERLLTEPFVPQFVKELRRRGVEPLSVGRAIVATWEPNESIVLETIHDLGLELHVIFNKGAVMVLPSGINKGTGLRAALKDMRMSQHNTVGIGDAENDHAFLTLCECAVAVANALPIVRERADLTTAGDHGYGVMEVVDHLFTSDLAIVEDRLARHDILLGTDDGGEAVGLEAAGRTMLVSGPSASGKSQITRGIMERLFLAGYQFCLIDPEGDYSRFAEGIILGDGERAPGVSEVVQLLENPAASAVVNLLGMPMRDRPSFFASLIPHLQQLRARTGRPHWLVLDEAHHVLPASWRHAAGLLPPSLKGAILVTVHPRRIAPTILESVNAVLAVGQDCDQTVVHCAEALGVETPAVPCRSLEPGEALYWRLESGQPPLRLKIAPTRAEHRRHLRKYAEGELKPYQSFYFRGPEGRLKLRAQNLQIFTQMAEGVDDRTWLFHLRRGDYSAWINETIKDLDLAHAVAAVEKNLALDADRSRARVIDAIEQRYTALRWS